MSSDVLEEDGSVTGYTRAVKQRQQETVSVWTEVGWESPVIMPQQFFIKGTGVCVCVCVCVCDVFVCVCARVAHMHLHARAPTHTPHTCHKHTHTLTHSHSLTLTHSLTHTHPNTPHKHTHTPALPSAQGFSRLSEWVGKLLGRTIFRADRVAVCAKNLEKDITAALRDGAFFLA